MTITVEFWDLIKGGFALATTLIAAFWVLARIIAQQFTASLEAKFKAEREVRALGQEHWDKRFNEQDESINKVQAQLDQLTRELPDRYQRREDAIRETAVLHAKLDGLGTKLDALIMGRLHERN